MKVFIVFIGLLLVNVSFLVYHADINRYVQAQIFLKALAEECAAGAALYIDEADYSNGKFVFNYNEGYKFADYIINKSKDRMPFNKDSIILSEITYQDDLQGYDDENNRYEENIPSVTVKLEVVTKDMFSLPFLEMERVVRMAKYELPGG